MVANVRHSTDSDLGQTVFRHLNEQRELSANNVNVKADGAVITLSGFVKSLAEKITAEKAALQVKGVKALANDIEVRPSTELADPDIAKEILRSFQSRILIPGDQIKVIVSKGEVTLEGIVRSQFEKLIAEAAIKTVRGVTGITNRIEVEPQAFSPRAGRNPRAEPQESEGANLGENSWFVTGPAEAG